tara:strand:+ start:14199 stop:14633 length:435 start_codon:yes stop_codon:yes gene_type:complete
VNTPAHADAMDIAKDPPEEPKDGGNANSGPLEITAEEEEWLKKLHDSKIAWYPWPSDDKIRTGNLYKLMYWQAKGKDTDDFDIYAHEEAERMRNLPEEEQLAPVQEPGPEAQPAPVEPREVQQPHVPRPAPAPKIFDAFDDLDD